jgi:phosphatidylserine/phosphatidylglycerophosphate/cardiolipin synthase-like enzyme
VFGDHTVWTGSYNFTKQATTHNRENAVVLRDSSIAARYLQEFHKIKREGCRPYRQYLVLKAERKALALIGP